MSSVERRATAALRKPPEQRLQQDLDIIYAFLHGISDLSNLHGSAIRDLCRIVRLEFYEASRVLFCRGQQATCWYILLSGCVFINGSLFLPTNSFGKRTAGYLLRNSDCVTLEPCSVLVIDYPNVPYPHPTRVLSFGSYETSQQQQLQQDAVASRELVDRRLRARGRMVSDNMPVDTSDLEIEFRPQVPYPALTINPAPAIHISRTSSSVSDLGSGLTGAGGEYNRPKQRGSRASDTSSICSGSDSMPQSSVDDPEQDSDDEEVYPEANGSLIGRDRLRECLEKDRSDRTDDDIEVLLDFMQHLPAFANMTLSTRRALCAVMVFAVVEKAGTIVMNDGEELDSWSVILNGHVEVTRPNGSIEHLHMGDSFGISVEHTSGCHEGVMRTKVDDCQFVCIEKVDYCRILHQGEENTKIHEEGGDVVLVTEYRVLDGGNRKGHIVIKGKPERLLHQLVEEHSAVDSTYVEDLLLTYRTFLKTPPFDLTSRLLDWFADVKLRDKVTRVVLLWVNNHFNDFEGESVMTEFLEKFEQLVEKEGMAGQLRLLHIACSAKAKPRTVVLVRSSRDEVLPFTVLGGLENKCGIFINKVDLMSRAFNMGLKRGDQILDVNNQSFEYITHLRALELLRGSTHLSLTVKYNPLAFKEMLLTSDSAAKGSGGSGKNKKTPVAQLQKEMAKQRHSAPNTDAVSGMPPIINSKVTKDKGLAALASNPKQNKLLQVFKGLNILPRGNSGPAFGRSADDTASSLSSSVASSPSVSKRLSGSSSIPDLTKLDVYERRDDTPQHIIRVYRADQTFKHLLIHKETSAHEVVMLALKEFGITEPSKNYSLCEVLAESDGLLKQKRLPDQMAGLQDRLALNGRYYLKSNSATETLVPSEGVQELLREAQVSLIQLQSAEVAAQLTLRDFQLFRDIEPTEFVDDIFELESRFGTSHLVEFSALVNKEMFWVVSEVCSETQIVKRAKLIKHFIKIARHCQECKNFNSLFAIVGGLGHRSVSRLTATWDKVPDKYTKMFADLQDLMDPSRNMSKYRNMLNSEKVTPPLIPFFPVVKKDLTFIHLGNDSKLQGLVNFEKLRMISKEIRHCCNMASAQYDVSDVYSNYGTYQDVFSAFGNTSVSMFATVRRKRRSAALPNAKRLYEQAQMVKRVRAYLKQLRVEEDEQKLQALSYACEAPPESLRKTDANGVASSTTSLVSSSSKTNGPTTTLPPPASRPPAQPAASGPKFGTDTPDTVRKLMSLSEKSQPYNPKKHPAPAPAQPTPSVSQKTPGSPHHPHITPPLPVNLSAESSSVASMGCGLSKRASTASTTSSTHSTGATSGVDSESASLSSFNFDTTSLTSTHVVPPNGDARSLSSGPSQSSVPLHLNLFETGDVVDSRVPFQRHQHYAVSHVSRQARPVPPPTIPFPSLVSKTIPTSATQLPVGHFNYPPDSHSATVASADDGDIYQQWPGDGGHMTSSHSSSRLPLPAYEEVLNQNPEYREYVHKTYQTHASAIQRPIIHYDPHNHRPVDPGTRQQRHGLAPGHSAYVYNNYDTYADDDQ